MMVREVTVGRCLRRRKNKQREHIVKILKCELKDFLIFLTRNKSFYSSLVLPFSQFQFSILKKFSLSCWQKAEHDRFFRFSSFLSLTWFISHSAFPLCWPIPAMRLKWTDWLSGFLNSIEIQIDSGTIWIFIGNLFPHSNSPTGNNRIEFKVKRSLVSRPGFSNLIWFLE